MKVTITSPSSSVMFAMAVSLLFVVMVYSSPTVRKEPKHSVGVAIEPDGTVDVADVDVEEGAVLGDLSGRERGRSELDRAVEGKRKSPVAVDLKFGGASHADGKQDRDNNDLYGRAFSTMPEIVKSEACEQKACHDCKDMQTCWHGVEIVSPKEAAKPGVSSPGWGERRRTRSIPAVPEGRKYARYGALELKLPAGSNTKYTFYTAEVYASCPSDGTKQKWVLDLEKVINGRLEIYTDVDTPGHFKKMIDKSNGLDVALEAPDTSRRRQGYGNRRRRVPGPAIFKPKKVDLNLNGKQARVRWAFYPSDRTKDSMAVCTLSASDIPPHVDDCMTVKDCLALLGDGSEAGFELRNVNDYQLDCLEGTSLSSKLQAKCEKWHSCMDNSNKTKPLTAFLRAALQKRRDNAGLAATASNVTQALAGNPLGGVVSKIVGYFNSNTCIDPFVDDAEAYDCECLGGMVKDCEASLDPLEDCLRATMCKIEVVCSHWKEVNCPEHAEELSQKTSHAASFAFSAMEARRQASIKSGGSESLEPQSSSGLMDMMANRSSSNASTKNTEKDMNNAGLDNTLSGKCNI